MSKVNLKQVIRKTPRVLYNYIANRLYTPVIILIYHRVIDISTDPQQLAVKPNNFREQISFIKKNYNILRFEDNWDNISTPSVVITFDDGYADNLYEASVILNELEVPATFFISTSTVGSKNEFWWDQLERILLLKGKYPNTLSLHTNESTYQWKTQTSKERDKLYIEVHAIMRKVDSRERAQCISQLLSWANIGPEGRETHLALNVNELVKMAENKWVTIGAHTDSHTPLSILSAEEQYIDILKSKQKLENWLEKEINVFSYPFGSRSDYDTSSIKACKDIGFVKVASNFSGQYRKGTDCFQLPRNLVRDWPIGEFIKQFGRFWIK